MTFNFFFKEITLPRSTETEKTVYENPPGSVTRPPGGKQGEWRRFVWRLMFSAFLPMPRLAEERILNPEETMNGFRALGEGDGVTWLGHSTFLIRQSGLTLLTDPFLTKYASPYPPFGPKRHSGPALRTDQLPPIDILLVSHNHFDHLDERTLRRLPNKDKIQVLVPLGVGKLLQRLGFTNVKELDWHQAFVLGNIEVRALPVVHGSARSLKDRNQTLWCGFKIQSENTHLFFAGDTAYGEVFAELGRMYGPFDAGLLPIGAYHPDYFFQRVHINPEEAVQVAQDMGIRHLIAMHWGNIVMTKEPIEEPPRRFVKAGQEAGISGELLHVLKIGESYAITPESRSIRQP